RETGRPALDVLAEALPGLIAALRFGKSMRWNSTGVAFSRPIRWLLALLGDQVVPFEYAGLSSSHLTRGLRPYGSPRQEVKGAADYADLLQTQNILLDPAARRANIQAQIAALAAQVGGRIPDD